MVTFSDSVRARDDARLVALLSRRPDLASPSPSTLLSLAARAMSRASVQRAVATLDVARSEVLECVSVLDLLGETATAERVVSAVLGPAPDDDDADEVLTILSGLEEMALVWQPEDGVYRPAPGVDEVQETFPAGLGPSIDPAPSGTGRPAAREVDGPQVLAALEDAPSGARSILAALAWGPPVGRTPASATGPTAAPTQWLLSHGLVRKADAHHVVVPREVAMVLREGRTHRGLTPEPALPEATLPPETVDAESSRAAQEVVRLLTELIGLWQVTPAATLKSGGLGVRDLRRLALRLETSEPVAATVVELAQTSGLVVDDGDDPPSFAPTLEADDWLAADLPARWAAVVSAWSTSTRTPWLVGTRDERGALRSALEPELHRPWVPRLRSEILGVLAQAPGATVDAAGVVDVLRWRSPRSVPPLEAVSALLDEAALLGVTGAGALSAAGRVLAGVPALTVPDEAARAALADTMSAALPAAVDDLLLQGDLTGIVPGRPSPALEALLADCADVESRGAALTVRFSAESVTRALDAGRTGEEFLAELAEHSRSGVPQPLEYLVRDAARRHGQVRLGAATAYVRVEDPVLLAGLVEDPRLRSLGLFRIAPTVLAATATPRQLLTVLRERGLAPAMEGPDGQIVHADRRTPRVRLSGRRPRRVAARGRVDGTDPAGTQHGRTERLEALVAQLRRGSQPRTATAQDGGPAVAPDPRTATTTGTAAGGATTPASASSAAAEGTTEPVVALGLLREAASDGQEVWVDIADAAGSVTRRRVRPLRLDAGRLRAVDVARESELTVAVHRIVTVEPVTAQP